MIHLSKLIKKQFWLGLFLLAFLPLVKAQEYKNLVPNSSFEAFNECIRGFSAIDIAHRPQKYLTDWVSPSYGSPDAYHVCFNTLFTHDVFIDEVGVPYNIGGYIQPLDGEGYTGIYLFVTEDLDVLYQPYREYLQVQLKKPLVKDREYCFSFYVRPMDTLTAVAASGGTLYTSKHIGVNFAAQQLLDTVDRFSYGVFNAVPQIKADTIINNSKEWTLISGVYKSTGGEQWLTIGNFENDTVSWADAQLIHKGNPNAQFKAYAAYYFIDKVSLHELDEFPLFRYSKIYPVCDAFPVTIYADDRQENYKWSTGATTQYTSIPDTGLYWVETAYIGCTKTARDSVIVIALPAPTVDLGADIDICKDGTLRPVTLKNKTALDNYYWGPSMVHDSATFSQPGIYRLRTDHVCGMFYDEIELIGCESTLFIPNIITPDSGDPNAIFLPSGRNVQIMLLEVYDNWGHLLYKEDNPVAGWNGESNGKSVNPGVYIWKLRYLLEETGTIEDKIGDITVIR
jgi:hypothetical protein